jgi:hypothetical protein
MEQQFCSVTSINILISLLFVFAWYRLSDIVKHADIKLHVTELYYYYCLVEQNYPSQNQKKLTYQALVQSILLYRAETWTLNTQQANKLLATEVDFWKRSARESRKEKVRNGTIRAIMEVGKNILEVIEENQRESEEGEDPKRDG